MNEPNSTNTFTKLAVARCLDEPLKMPPADPAVCDAVKKAMRPEDQLVLVKIYDRVGGCRPEFVYDEAAPELTRHTVLVLFHDAKYGKAATMYVEWTSGGGTNSACRHH